MAEPRKVSDIEIVRQFEVYCEEHGVVDAPRSYRRALASRRLHFERDHDGGRQPGPAEHVLRTHVEQQGASR